jgi:hypothetical protein
MIRPLTIATCLLACVSGLYLYQSKHEVQLLDRTIERTVHDTNALREQSRLLAAEWTMLNDPERLRQFSDTYLSLKTITPTQFTSLTDLDNRLPAAQAEIPSQGTDEQELVPVAVGASPATTPDAPAEPAAATVAEEDLPVPPIPTAPRAPVVASVAQPRAPDRVVAARPAVADNQIRPATTEARPYDQRVAEQRPADQRPSDQRAAPRLVAAEARSPEQRMTEQRMTEQRTTEQRAADQRPPEQHMAARVADARTDVRQQPASPYRPIILGAPRPLPTSTPATMAPAPAQPRPAMVAASAPYSGSLLGMARGSMPPAPRPTPVNASYNAN